MLRENDFTFSDRATPAYAGRSLGSTILLCFMIGASFALIALLKFGKTRSRLVVARSAYPQTAEVKATKIVTFNSEEAAVAEQ